jgi:hypothetical protein
MYFIINIWSIERSYETAQFNCYRMLFVKILIKLLYLGIE